MKEEAVFIPLVHLGSQVGIIRPFLDLRLRNNSLFQFYVCVSIGPRGKLILLLAESYVVFSVDFLLCFLHFYNTSCYQATCHRYLRMYNVH